MELLPPVRWSDVARRSDITALRGELAELRAELKGEMAGLRAGVDRRFAQLERRIAQMMVAQTATFVGLALAVLRAV